MYDRDKTNKEIRNKWINRKQISNLEINEDIRKNKEIRNKIWNKK